MQNVSDSPQPLSQPHSDNEHSDLRILLAEDNVLNQKLTLRQLHGLGYCADVVNNGQAAVEAVTRSQYDLVLMDCKMPVMDGFAATLAIRKWERNPLQRSTPVIIIAMTASDLEADRQQALITGMNDYLTKPVRREMLETLLERWQQVVRPAFAMAAGANAARDSTIAYQENAQTALSSHLNLHYLQRLSDGCPEFEVELLQVFVNDSYHHLHLLQQAVAHQNFPKIEQIAHHIKGASANVGASSMQHLADALEQRARQRQPQGLNHLTAQLEASLNHIQAFMQAHRETCVVE
ncbi:hypothetical protein C7B61_01035 [filamentous cyanobacterium CCP1]|nr:hypothetical protein C7B76_20305 [filamentous cyanobacterium CCP2]PSB68403.1 hypothetical protein C7B61_01035 [filamentous cyanobacterium CCP1]